ncbi:MAG TPA: protein kinase [Gemmataceae bacterium]|nr:protein kinase [Gemmataceae bacterium]
MAHEVPLGAGLEPYPGYRLTRRIGSGACGEVWEAAFPPGKNRALKFLRCGRRELAVREIRSLQAIRHLRHPRLVHIDNVWCYDGYVVVEMELADGSLADLLDAYWSIFQTPITAEHACVLLSEAAEALDHLNKRQHHINDSYVAIQHCDVKPSNLLLFGESLKVADFGLSSCLIAHLETRSRAGTLDYCAPEVFRGQLSNQTDQYALAVTYCLIRGGRLPFDDTPAFFQSSYIRPAPDLTMLPETERPILARALHPVPQSRWLSCGELMDHLSIAICARAALEEGASSVKDRRGRAHLAAPE